MKKIRIILILLNCYILGHAQRPLNQQGESFPFILKANIDMKKGGLQHDLQIQGTNPLKNIQLTVKDGAVIFQYKIQPLERTELYQVNLLEIKNLDTGIKYPIQSEYKYGVSEYPEYPDKSQQKIILANPPNNANYKYLNGTIQMAFVVKKLSVPIRCDDLPTFPIIKTAWPHLLGLGTGAGIWFIGQDFKKQADNIYLGEYATSKTLAEADPHYNRANDKYHRSQELKDLGITIAATSIGVYLIRYIVYRREKKLYDKLCTNARGFSLVPHFELGTASQAGLGIAYRF